MRNTTNLYRVILLIFMNQILEIMTYELHRKVFNMISRSIERFCKENRPDRLHLYLTKQQE